MKFSHHCLRCGKKWVSVKKRPVACPNCKQYKWDTVAGKVGRPKNVVVKNKEQDKLFDAFAKIKS
jgi:predicted  nucleic acid-binding Zn-ribbon protein